MRPVSAAFLRTLHGSHVMTARARVCSDFQTGTNPTGTEIPIIAGDVTHDGTADVRATLDLTTDGTQKWPANAGALLAPYGNEIFIERGVAYGNGVTEWVSQGYYRIDRPEQDVVPDGEIRISGSDRMAGIIDARLEAPRQWNGGTTTYGAVISQLVREVYPLATIEWDDFTSGDFIGRTLVTEDDRFGFCDDLVKSVGKIWYWDYRGVLVIKDPPNASNPVWTVDAGKGGVLVEMSRELTRQGVRNIVVATGEAADQTPPARGVARDANPNSPTYYAGRFGPVPQFFSSPLLLTNAQAAEAARSLLQQSLGLPYNVDWASIANPALEPYDPVIIKYPDRLRSGTFRTETHIIDQHKLGLTADAPSSATTREQTVVLITTQEG